MNASTEVVKDERLVKNTLELVTDISKGMGISDSIISKVVSTFTRVCINLVKNNQSFYLSDKFYVKVSTYDFVMGSCVVPYGALVKQVSDETKSPFFTVKEILDNLLTLCVNFSKRGYTSRIMGLITVRPDGRQGVHATIGAGVREIKAHTGIRVSIRKLDLLTA